MCPPDPPHTLLVGETRQAENPKGMKGGDRKAPFRKGTYNAESVFEHKAQAPGGRAGGGAPGGTDAAERDIARDGACGRDERRGTRGEHPCVYTPEHGEQGEPGGAGTGERHAAAGGHPEHPLAAGPAGCQRHRAGDPDGAAERANDCDRTPAAEREPAAGLLREEGTAGELDGDDPAGAAGGPGEDECACGDFFGCAEGADGRTVPEVAAGERAEPTRGRLPAAGERDPQGGGEAEPAGLPAGGRIPAEGSLCEHGRGDPAAGELCSECAGDRSLGRGGGRADELPEPGEPARGGGGDRETGGGTPGKGGHGQKRGGMAAPGGSLEGGHPDGGGPGSGLPGHCQGKRLRSGRAGRECPEQPDAGHRHADADGGV